MNNDSFSFNKRVSLSLSLFFPACERSRILPVNNFFHRLVFDEVCLQCCSHCRLWHSSVLFYECESVYSMFGLPRDFLSFPFELAFRQHRNREKRRNRNKKHGKKYETQLNSQETKAKQKQPYNTSSHFSGKIIFLMMSILSSVLRAAKKMLTQNERIICVERFHVRYGKHSMDSFGALPVRRETRNLYASHIMPNMVIEALCQKDL